MATKYTSGDRIPVPRFSSFRTLYPVLRNDVLFCFIGMRTGWGRLWEYYPLQISSEAPHIDGVGPSLENARASLALKKGVEAALEYLNTRGEDFLHSERFKDVNELRAIEKNRNASARKHLEDSRANLVHGIAEAERKRDLLKNLLDRPELSIPFLPASLTAMERSVIAEAAEIFDKEATSYRSTLRRVERDFADVTKNVATG